MGAERGIIYTLIAVAAVLGALLILILVPISFSDVHYYEYGILKRRSTGSVDLSKIYTSGRWFVGPDYTFKTFRADAHFVTLDRVGVFTEDKVEVTITCTFQYFIRPKYLARLHEAYDVDYSPVVKSTAIDAIKGRAAKLKVDQYIRHREAIENELFKALLQRLDGCCRSSCKGTVCETYKICLPENKCKAKDYGLFIEVKYFQLQEFDIHNDVKSRYLSQVMESAEEERSQFVQKEKLVRRDTETLVNKIENEATVIAQNATARSTIIMAKARAEAMKLVENARTDGLRSLYTALGISPARGNYTQKASLIYLRTLRNKKSGVTLNVNYKSILLKG